MKFLVTVDRDADGVWVAECALCLEVRAERGLPLTIETRQIEVAI